MLITLYFLWPSIFIFNYYINNYSNKLNKNFIAFLHCCACIYFNYLFSNYYLNDLFLKDFIYNLSTSYFFIDLLYLIFTNFLKELPYIYHHIICLVMLNQFNNNINKLLIPKLLYIGELSNLIFYIVYYMINTKQNKYIMNTVRIFQMLWFIYYRFYYFGWIIFTYGYDYKNKIVFSFLISLYLLGYIWGFGQFKLVYKKIIKPLFKSKKIKNI